MTFARQLIQQDRKDCVANARFSKSKAFEAVRNVEFEETLRRIARDKKNREAFYQRQNANLIARLDAIYLRRNQLFPLIGSNDATAQDKEEYQALNAEKIEIEEKLSEFKVKNGWK